MAYPDTIPTVEEITNIVNDVTVQNAESIQSGVALVIRQVMTALGTNPEGSAADVKTRLAIALSDSGEIDTSSAANFYSDVMMHNAQVNVELTNQSGGALSEGDVVIVDPSNSQSVTTTTTVGDSGILGVVSETGPVADGDPIRVCVLGVALVNVASTVIVGNLIAASTTVKKADTALPSVGANILGKSLTSHSSQVTAMIMPGGGTSGFSGYSGALGASGVSGASGWTGASGYTGTSGYSAESPGTSGYSGYSGLGQSGYSGKSGTTGFSGYSGISGIIGTSGYSGTSGTTGFSGFGGVSGTLGDVGTSGYSGTSGVTGFSGFSGMSGVAGACPFIFMYDSELDNWIKNPIDFLHNQSTPYTGAVSTTRLYTKVEKGLLKFRIAEVLRENTWCDVYGIKIIDTNVGGGQQHTRFIRIDDYNVLIEHGQFKEYSIELPDFTEGVYREIYLVGKGYYIDHKDLSDDRYRETHTIDAEMEKHNVQLIPIEQEQQVPYSAVVEITPFIGGFLKENEYQKAISGASGYSGIDSVD